MPKTQSLKHPLLPCKCFPACIHLRFEVFVCPLLFLIRSTRKMAVCWNNIWSWPQLPLEILMNWWWIIIDIFCSQFPKFSFFSRHFRTKIPRRCLLIFLNTFSLILKLQVAWKMKIFNFNSVFFLVRVSLFPPASRAGIQKMPWSLFFCSSTWILYEPSWCFPPMPQFWSKRSERASSDSNYVWMLLFFIAVREGCVDLWSWAQIYHFRVLVVSIVSNWSSNDLHVHTFRPVCVLRPWMSLSSIFDFLFVSRSWSSSNLSSSAEALVCKAMASMSAKPCRASICRGRGSQNLHQIFA